MRGGYHPVGARDSYTMGLLKSHGIPAELVGCATLTLPEYNGPRQGKYSIDVDPEPGTRVLSSDIPRLSWLEEWELGLRRLEILQKAEIVYSSRIHVILPCLAFGTPVVFPSRGFVSLFDKTRLSLLHDIGFRYDQPFRMDVGSFASHFRSFLSSFLDFPLEAGSWPPPAPVPIVGRSTAKATPIRSRALSAKTHAPPALLRKVPSVTAMVISRNGAERLGPCLESIRLSGFADDIAVCIDRRSTDDSFAVARQFTENISLLDAEGGIDWAYGRVAEPCKGEFVLRLDDDELLRGDWNRQRFNRLVAFNDITHFFIPFRWAVPNERFIAERPWYPGLQNRLFRNDPRLVTWPKRIHEQLDVQGASLVWPDGWIEHRNLVQTTREQREEKCRAYRAARPDKHFSEMYLYEGQELATLPLDIGPEFVFKAGIQDPEWVSPVPYDPGSEIDFKDNGNSSDFTPTGWSPPEAWGRWTVGPLAEIRLPLDRPLGTRALFHALVHPYVNRQHRPLHVEIYFGKHLLKTMTFRMPGRRTIRVPIPAALAAQETRPVIGIRILNPKSPRTLGISNDPRELGLGFVRAWLK